ncbi:MAG TPA: uroporphyrinogen decarboxylase family protein [Acidobacteriota bacterium]|nr:uroporphyrinogen decarboxylase family protein [Acidobacteriota bacterium]
MAGPFPHLPLAKARPDARRFIDTVMGRARPGQPPLVEYLVDEALRQPITEEILGRPWVDPAPGDRAGLEASLSNFIAFWHSLGYDFVRFEESLTFVESELVGPDRSLRTGERHWRDMKRGAISTWADLESYPWPAVAPASFRNYEYLATHLPEGMGLMACHAGGMLEHLAAIFSYEGLCYALHDQPDLVAAAAARLGEIMLAFYRQLVELPNLIAVFPGDDMGFRSATLLPPAALRHLILPWHKRFAGLAHGRGIPYFLHSCGNLEAIMDDLIEDVGIDAKHSFENAIMPVEEFQTRYGGRVGVLGGIDVDRLARAAPDGVRAEVRRTIEVCQPRGRFAVGSGNSIPSYVPVENYLAMVDEALRPRGLA